MAKQIAASDTDALNTILHIARTTPMLSKEEEKQLWETYFSHDASEAQKTAIRDRISRSHFPLAISIARKYQRFNQPLSEIIGPALYGISQALNRYDPQRGARFSTYAANWIKAEVQNFIYADTPLKTGNTTFTKFLFANYNRLLKEAEYQHPTLSTLEIQEKVAETLIENGKAPSKKLEEVVASIRDHVGGRAHAFSLDAPVAQHDADSVSMIETMVDTDQLSADEALDRKQRAAFNTQTISFLQSAFERAGKQRDWDILSARRLKEDPDTLQALAEKLGISRARVEQIEKASFERCRELIEQRTGGSPFGGARAKAPEKTRKSPLPAKSLTNA